MRKLFLQISLAMISLMSFAALCPAIVSADCANPVNTKEAIQCGTSNASGVPVTNDPTQSINDTISQALKILSVAVGIISVVMIVVAGYRFMTSGGDTTKVASAKSTLMYALIGLVVVVLSQIIVIFVLGTASNPTAPTPAAGTPGGSCRGITC